MALYSQDPLNREIRTSRQRTLPQVGASGQQRIEASSVVIVGAGGLGSPLIQYLAAAGVGTIHVFDDDKVELSNLNRQVIHSAERLGVPKVDNAITAAARIAPEVRVIGHKIRLTPQNISSELSRIRDESGLDVIVDGSDSFDTRFTVHAGATELGLPVIFGAVMQWSAQVTMFWSNPLEGDPIVLTDLFEDTEATRATPGCAETGIMGSVTGMVGSLLATETIKFILGVGESLLGRMLVLDALTSTIREIPLTNGSIASSQVSLDKDAPYYAPHQIVAVTPEEVPAHAIWIDVRRAEESALSPGPVEALRLPFDEVLQLGGNNSSKIPENVSLASLPIVAFCASGPRSLLAARHLDSIGYIVVGYLDGGLAAHPSIAKT